MVVGDGYDHNHQYGAVGGGVGARASSEWGVLNLTGHSAAIPMNRTDFTPQSYAALAVVALPSPA
jgi:hypothetical protein